MLKANPGYSAFNLDLHFSRAADSKVTTLYCKRAPADPGLETTTKFDDKRFTTNRRLTTQDHSKQRMKFWGEKQCTKAVYLYGSPVGKYMSHLHKKYANHRECEYSHRRLNE